MSIPAPPASCSVQVQLVDDSYSTSFYSGPLRGIFSTLRRFDILRDVQILSLDGLSVTAELVHDILVDPSFSVRILSIRGAKNLNEPKLRGALQYACRDSRPEGMPRLKGLYFFGPRDTVPTTLGTPPSPVLRSVVPSPGIATAWNDRSQRALNASLVDEPEAWYARRGAQFPRRIDSEWASTLLACEGIIAFDTVMCTGPRHLNSPAWGTVNIEALNAARGSATSVPHYGVATHSLGGCANCGSAPEGWTVWGEDELAATWNSCGRKTSASASKIGRFPLLAPPPMQSPNLNVAMCPAGQPLQSRLSQQTKPKDQRARFIPRCLDCIRDRYCAGCHRWWCESCYVGPGQAGMMHPNANPVSNSLPNTSDPSVVSSGEPNYLVRDWLCLDGECAWRLTADE